MSIETTQVATVAAGCFWCVEAVFRLHKGVISAVSGYMGGTTLNPTYKEVCGDKTGHAEVVQVTFDPQVVSYAELLEVFWRTHDPTLVNRQGPDVGTQYRTAIFYHDDEQKRIAEASKAAATEAKLHSGEIVTEITKASTFYPAEDYHQDYYNKNPEEETCRTVIAPKMKKFQALFQDKLKEAAK